MNICPECGTTLPDGQTCRDLLNKVMDEEYMVLSPRSDFLAALKLTSVSYILQHPHEHTTKQLAFAARMLEMVFDEGYFPLNAADMLQRQFAYRLPAFADACLPDGIAYPINVGNFRRDDESFLDSAYRWGRSIFEILGCDGLKAEPLQMTSSGMG